MTQTKRPAEPQTIIPDYCEKGTACKRYGFIQTTRDREELLLTGGTLVVLFCSMCKHFKPIDLYKTPRRVDSFRGNMINQVIMLNQEEIKELDPDMYRVTRIGSSKLTEKESKVKYDRVIVTKNNP